MITARQKEVIKAWVETGSQKLAADRLGISIKIGTTVKLGSGVTKSL